MVNILIDMKIIIKVENDSGDSKDLTLSNDELDNYNFVEFKIGDKVYDASVDDLFEAVLTFKRIKDNDDEKDFKYREE